MSTSNLQSGVVVITGGGGGVGLAAAELVGADHPVVLAERNGERLDAALAALARSGIKADGVVADVTDAADVAAVLARAEQLGPLSLLLHAAGLSPSMADARTILRVNVLGTHTVLSAVQPLLVEGSVGIVVASMAGHRSRAVAFDALLDGPWDDVAIDALTDAALGQSRPAYALSKRFCIREVARLARSWGARGARIASISPGVIDTEMGRLETGSSTRGNPAASLSVAAIDRVATAREVADAALLIADVRAGYVTGCDLLVDGGTIAGFRHHADETARQGWDDPWVAR